jgi:ribonuclease HI
VEAPANQPEHWIIYLDGSLKLGGGGAGVLFISPRGEQLKYMFQILFEVSNNEAEYEALLHGLRLAISLGIKRLLIYGDSKLVVQVPVLQQTALCPSSQPHYYTIFMAICMLGP